MATHNYTPGVVISRTLLLLSFLQFAAVYVQGACIFRLRHPLPPSIALRRRIIANFVKGSTDPYIKILFISDRDVNVTWFRQSKNSLPLADPPNMLQVASTNGYYVSSLRSWNVRASTLHVNADDYNNSQEVSYVTTFEFEQEAISYRLVTVIPRRNEQNPTVDNLTGMQWLLRPNVTVTYKHGDTVHLGCTARKEMDASQEKGELILYNIDLPTDDSNLLGDMVENPSLLKVHPGDAEKNVDDGTVRFVSQLQECSTSKEREFSFDYTTHRGTAETQGLYVCRMDDGLRSMYASATVRRNIPLSTKPRVKLVPCEQLTVKPNEDLLMVPGKETCLRCQGYGDRISDVVLIKEGREIQGTSNILVRKHVNVKKGGLRETVYTFLKPDRNLVGQYKCEVTQMIPGRNPVKAEFPFEITLLDKAGGQSARRSRRRRISV